MVASSSSRALSPANDPADTRVRQNSKQREEELELIEQLRKVRADKTSEPLSKCLVCHRVKAALVFWTDCTEPIMVRSWPELNGTVQSECFFQMDADWAAVKYTALTPACDWPVIFAFRMNACFPPYHPSYCGELPGKFPQCLPFDLLLKIHLCCKACRKAGDMQRLQPVMMTACFPCVLWVHLSTLTLSLVICRVSVAKIFLTSRLFVCWGPVHPGLCPWQWLILSMPQGIQVPLCFAPGMLLLSVKGFLEVLSCSELSQ